MKVMPRPGEGSTTLPFALVPNTTGSSSQVGLAQTLEQAFLTSLY